MNINIEEGQTLLGLCMPCNQQDLKNMIKGWKQYMAPSIQDVAVEKLTFIEFRNKRGDKVKVYQGLIRAIDKKWFKVSKIDLARYLAKHTNLATNPDIELRTNTIYHFLKQYKKTFTYAA